MSSCSPAKANGGVDLAALLRKADAETEREEAQQNTAIYSLVPNTEDREALVGTHAQRAAKFAHHSHVHGHAHNGSKPHVEVPEVASRTPTNAKRSPLAGNSTQTSSLTKKMTLSDMSKVAKMAKMEAESDKLTDQFEKMNATPSNVDNEFDDASDDDNLPHFGLMKKREGGPQRRLSSFDKHSDDSDFNFFEHLNIYGETMSEGDYNAFDLDAQEEWADDNWFGLKYIALARHCLYIAEHDWFDSYMLVCIALAGIIVGLDTYPGLEGNEILVALDTFVLCSFAFEVLVRTIGEGLTPWRFFTNAQWRWNTFDFLIVFFSIPLIPFATRNVKILRVVRLLRLTHIFKRIPQLNMIMRGLVDSLNFVSYIVLLWFMALYIYAIIGFELFAKNDPWHFGTIEHAVIALLQVTCMDGWGQIFDVNYYGCEDYNGGFYTMDPALGTNEVGALMLCDPVPQPLLTTIYFISYVTLTAFCVIPLFIGAVSISMTDCVAEMEREKKEEDRRLCLERLKTVDDASKHPAMMTRKEKRAMDLVGLAFKGDPIVECNVASDSSVRYRLHAKYREFAALCALFIERPRVQRLITLAIITGGVVVGLQTDEEIDATHHSTLVLLNDLILYIFTAEVVLKMIAEVEYPYMYFADNWNIFDFVVVAGSYLPVAGSSVIILRLMRLMRLVRVLKLMRQFQNLQVIIEGATDGLTAACYISAIICIIYYFFAILGNVLFAENDPASWGQVHLATIILFQIATQDNWTPYFYTIIFGCENQPSPLMFDEEAQCTHSQAQFFAGTLYFTIFTIFGSYVLLALFVGSIGNAMDAAHARQKSLNRVKKRVKILKHALGLSTAEIEGYREAFDFIDVSGEGRIGSEELHFGLSFADQKMSEEQFEDCWNRMDRDGTSDIDFSEFLIFMLEVRTLALEKANASDPNHVMKLSGFSDFLDENGNPPGTVNSSSGETLRQLAKGAGEVISEKLSFLAPNKPQEQEVDILRAEDEEEVDSDLRRITSAFTNMLDDGDIELSNLGSSMDAEERLEMQLLLREATNELLTEAAESPRRPPPGVGGFGSPVPDPGPRPGLSPGMAAAVVDQVADEPVVADAPQSPRKLPPLEPFATGPSRSLLMSPARCCVNLHSSRVGTDALEAAIAVIQRAWKVYRGREEFEAVSAQIRKLALVCPQGQKWRRRDSLYRPYKGIYLPDDEELRDRIRGGITRVVEFYDPEEVVEFIDCDCGQILSRYEDSGDKKSSGADTDTENPSWSVEKRLIALTDKALYLLSYSPDDYKTKELKLKVLPLLLLERRIELHSLNGLQRVHISHLADCVIGLAVTPNIKIDDEQAEKRGRMQFEDSSSVSRCPITSTEFSFVNPRRHCRVSGLAFCASACNYRQPFPDDGFENERRVGDPFIGLKSIQQREDILLACKRKSELLCLIADHYESINRKVLMVIIGNRLRMRPGVYNKLARVPAREVSFLGGWEADVFSTTRGRRGSFAVRNMTEGKRMVAYSHTFGLNLVCNALSHTLRVYSENGLPPDAVERLNDLRMKTHEGILDRKSAKRTLFKSPRPFFDDSMSSEDEEGGDDGKIEDTISVAPGDLGSHTTIEAAPAPIDTETASPAGTTSTATETAIPAGTTPIDAEAAIPAGTTPIDAEAAIPAGTTPTPAGIISAGGDS